MTDRHDDDARTSTPPANASPSGDASPGGGRRRRRRRGRGRKAKTGSSTTTAREHAADEGANATTANATTANATTANATTANATTANVTTANATAANATGTANASANAHANGKTSGDGNANVKRNRRKKRRARRKPGSTTVAGTVAGALVSGDAPRGAEAHDPPAHDTTAPLSTNAIADTPANRDPKSSRNAKRDRNRGRNRKRNRKPAEPGAAITNVHATAEGNAPANEVANASASVEAKGTSHPRASAKSSPANTPGSESADAVAARRARAELETSAGGIVYRVHDGEALFLLIRDSYRNWGFPKGHLEAGELPAEAAVREVQEETGIAQLQLDGAIETIDWFFRFRGKLVHKVCHFFLMRTEHARTVPQREEGITACRWARFEEATRLISYANARAVLTRANAMVLELGPHSDATQTRAGS